MPTGYIMFTLNQQALLALFISNPTQDYHLHEIGRIMGKKPGVFQKALNSLEKEGILKSQMRGNQRRVSLNKQYPLLKEISKIVQKTVGVEALLKEAVDMVPGIKIAFIFGSYIKDRMRSDSDIDLILVGGMEAEDIILEAIEKVERKIQREINPKFYSSKEYARKKKDKDPFLSEVLSSGPIVLKGAV